MTSDPETATEANPNAAGADPPQLGVPAPTAWPLVLALGLTLAAAGLVTTAAVSVLGLLLGVVAGVGWFGQVLPQERRESVPVREQTLAVTTTRPEVARIAMAPELKRLRFPLQVYPVAAGMRGGLAGGVAMALVAMAYGWRSHGSIWYPVNLLGAVVYSGALRMSAAKLTQFSLVLFLVALAIHATTSLLMGLLYGAMLPILPLRPVLLGGVIAPPLWSGLVYSVLGLVNPLLDARINWGWFVVSQVAFGCVAGLVVIRHAPVRVRQRLPLAMRAGLEVTGIPEEPRDRSETR